MAYHLQVCNSARHLGSREISEDTSITSRELAAIAEEMDRAHEIQLNEGVVYEIRVWDGEDRIWSGQYLRHCGKLNAVEGEITESRQGSFAGTPSADETPEQRERPVSAMLIHLEVIDSDKKVTLTEREAVHLGSIYTVPVAEIAERWASTSVINLTDGTRYELIVKTDEMAVWNAYYTFHNGRLVAG